MSEKDNVHAWTDEQTLAHLRGTFDLACREHPETMEPWMARVEGLTNTAELLALMRRALSSTIAERVPMHDGAGP